MAGAVNFQKDLRFHVVKTSQLDVTALDPMRADASQAGFKFIERLCDEWARGVNRFDREGEALFLALDDENVIGVCGVNRDPYSDDIRTGRVRRLYVVSTYRGRGVGQALLDAVIAQARTHFEQLRVRTDEANDFYSARGFRRLDGDAHATHELLL
jgi:N-acetylglutamate synthase-like GNAT family acetyltransferase